jgi:hypothetical protein
MTRRGFTVLPVLLATSALAAWGGTAQAEGDYYEKEPEKIEEKSGGGSIGLPMLLYGPASSVDVRIQVLVGDDECFTATVGEEPASETGFLWVSQVEPGVCGISSGTKLRFAVNGQLATEYVKFRPGGSPENPVVGIVLHVPEEKPATEKESSTPKAAPTLPEGPSTLSVVPKRGGVAAAIWSGGHIEEMIDAAKGMGCTIRSVAANDAHSASLVAFLPGAPTLVNKRFLSAYPEGAVPLSAVLVACR